MPVIRFAKNWNNKLDCNYFTTIRLYTDEKYKYYIHSLRKEFSVLLKGKKFCRAKLIEVEATDLSSILIQHLNYTDAGLDEFDFVRLLERFYKKKPQWRDKDTDLLVLVFEKVNNK
jgi:hypothetical protein